MNEVAQRIQALLDERGEKLKPVAEAAGVTYYSIYPWWSRENAKPSYEKVSALANYFGVPVGHLMYGEPRTENSASPEAVTRRMMDLSDEDRKAVESYVDHLLAKKNSDPQS